MGVFATLGVLSGLQLREAYAGRGVLLTLQDALFTGWLDWGLWAPLVPVLVIVNQRIVAGRTRWTKMVLAQLATAVALTLVHVAAFASASAGIRQWRFGSSSIMAELRSGFWLEFHVGLATVILASGAMQWVLAARRIREQEVREHGLARRLSEARLETLRARVRPHFLFNALNTVAALVHTDAALAERTVERLSTLLRRSLKRDERATTTFDEELRFTREYLEIERARFGDRIDVREEVAPGAGEALVPVMLLQPLVENAVRHAVSRAAALVTIWIRAARSEGRLRLEVQDDGPGPAPRSFASGFGIDGTRDRLRLLYGDDQLLTVEAAERGVHARVEVPFRSAAAGGGAAP